MFGEMSADNPYASPQPISTPAAEAAQSVGAWRDGNLLIVGPGASLPDRCVKCNEPAAGYRKRMKLAWHSPVAFLGLFLGLLPYIIIALIMTKRMTVHVGICQRHVSARNWAILYTFLGAAAGVGLIILAGVYASGWLVFAGLVAWLVTLIYGLRTSRIVWPKKIDKRFAWIKGVCPEYLASLPNHDPA